VAGRPKFNARTARKAGRRTQFSSTRQPKRRRGWIARSLPPVELGLAEIDRRAAERRAEAEALEAALAARRRQK
jgi:hypothetical protein